MTGPADSAVTSSRADERRAAIRRAAVQEFLARGHAATSMANIAAAAGVSRPALYQYFADKDDVFASAFAWVFEVHTTEALAGLRAAPSVGAALDALLQRNDGDLWELVEGSDHYDEIVAAKSKRVTSAVAAELDRFWAEVARWIETVHPGEEAACTARRAGWLAVLRWAPHGLRFDRPAVPEFRKRLSALARSVASDIESAT